MHGVSSNSPLPPSVETAYYRKCIELKRRINDIEENNDILRTRKGRVNRAVLKLRMERAILLERIRKNMDLNLDESDRSTSPPRTVSSTLLHTNGHNNLMHSVYKQPQEKPLRSKRGHRSKVTPPPSTSANAGTNISPEGSAAGPSRSSAHHPPPPGSPDAAANRINQQFFNSYQQPPLSAPAAPPLNGTAAILPAPATTAATPQAAATYAYDPTYDERRENGDAAAAAAPLRPGSTSVNNTGASAPVGSGAPATEQNGQAVPADTEMGDAGDAAGGFGGGFTAVNR